MNNYFAKQSDCVSDYADSQNQPYLKGFNKYHQYNDKSQCTLEEVDLAKTTDKDKQSRLHTVLNELQYQIIRLLNLFKDLNLAEEKVGYLENGIIALLNKMLVLSEIEHSLNQIAYNTIVTSNNP